MTPAKPPSPNTTANTMDERPLKRQKKMQSEVSFMDLAEAESERTRTTGTDRLDLGLRMLKAGLRKQKGAMTWFTFCFLNY